MGEEMMKAHWRYLIARYGAWPVVWCAAGEANLPWYLAEGSTQEPFDTWILLQNPGQQPASISVTFMTEQGIAKVLPMTVWPTSRLSLYANAVMPNAINR